MAPRGGDSTKGDREANKPLGRRQGPIAVGMQRAWRVREGAEGVYQEGQAWVTSFSDCFTLSMGGGAGVVVLGPLPLLIFS